MSSLKSSIWTQELLDERYPVEPSAGPHCERFGKAFYFKGQGEIDVIWLRDEVCQAVEVKWSRQIRPSDVKALQQFKQ